MTRNHSTPALLPSPTEKRDPAARLSSSVPGRAATQFKANLAVSA